MADPAIRFERVTKSFGPVRAVDAVSFDLPRGALVTLLGPSGCGKTTTLRLIAGLELPSEGRIEIEGRDVTRLAAAERRIAMVFQSYALFPHMTVLENVAYGLSVNGARRAAAEAEARAMLASLGLEGFEARLPAELSGGQQQRVAVARALVLRPKVLLFDEPLSNLDARLRRRVREDIRDLQRRLGLSVVYVTHDQQEALAVSDLVIVMRDGRIAQMGRPTELYEDPADSFVADFMGEANVIAGEVLAAEGGRARLRVGGVEVESAMRAHPPGPATLAVRPEAVTLAEAGGVPGRVVRAAFLGQTREYEVETAAGMLFVIAPASARAFAEGAAVGCRLERVIPLRG
ncbi:ABC transporter ATP-binding protein [Elioraea sp. Yellowstone]|jgi:iron(III) transport system ATP-binding protein|uniref:ABC transporter ATP-binding protein n=1 Tax=Elioraea sp. Yellowstone TaxID=2592070 RepID=UPI00114E44E3|nr:ABC transporter ATP-binding protein [Elioraea sp. Yellowstone]TQF79056.1 ABC transporter ATP-binding protein [Elioraea sp. Yellowstone]